MVNKSISKLLGTPRSDGQFAKSSTGTSRPKLASLGNLASTRIGYGVEGVSGAGGGSPKKRSQLHAARRDFSRT